MKRSYSYLKGSTKIAYSSDMITPLDIERPTTILRAIIMPTPPQRSILYQTTIEYAFFWLLNTVQKIIWDVIHLE